MWKETAALCIVALFFLPAQAMAQDDPACQEQYDAAVDEAQGRYDAEMEEAQADRDAVLDDSESDAEDRQRAWSEYNETRDEAQARLDADVADAERAYDECRARAAEDDRDSSGSGDGSDDEADRDDEADSGDEDDREDGSESDDGRDDDERDDDEAVPQRIVGRHVEVRVTPTGLQDYTVDSVVVLASVEGAATWDEYERDDTLHELEGEDQEARIVDSAAGNMRFRSEGVSITPPAGATFHRDGSSGHGDTRFRLDGPGFVAYLNGDRLRVDNGTLVAPREVRMALAADRSPAIEDAVATGAIVAEVAVNGGAEGKALGPVNLTTAKSAGEVVVTIEGHGEGRTLLFDLERDAIGRIEDLRVFFDGQEIHHADDLDDVLNVTDGGAEYLIVVGKERTQVLVQIPHFSVHEIRLQGSAVEVLHEPPVVAVAAGAVGAVLFVAATQTWRKRRG